MKKVLISLVVVAIVAVGVINFNLGLTENHKVSNLTLHALAEECEDGIKEQGTKITVTVCNRRTSTTGEEESRWCTLSSSNSCWFDNKGNGQQAN
jgi:hypothetical protein